MTRPLVNPVSETTGELTSGMNIGVGGQFQLREMSDTDIKNKFARLLMGFWANQNNGRGAITLKTDHTGNRGTWIMRFRNDASASHPVSTTNFAQDNYSLDQDEDVKTTNQADAVNLRPVCRTTGASFQIAANSPIVMYKEQNEEVYSGATTTHFTKITYPRG